jgi:16S rRNA (guanine966-N2)-methyltransferase
VRVIAGEAGGLRLVAPAGERTRPTTDRVRESVFAALEVRRGGFDGASVLDLFAGSGALGIELLSRGAARALFVDRAGPAAVAVEANLASTHLTGRARVLRTDAVALTAPAATAPVEAPFDVVLLDPPYEMSDGALAGVLERLADPAWSAPGATAIVERPALTGTFAPPAPWRSDWVRRFGDTLVVFAGLD